jgi:hypothetical protein
MVIEMTREMNHRMDLRHAKAYCINPNCVDAYLFYPIALTVGPIPTTIPERKKEYVPDPNDEPSL